MTNRDIKTAAKKQFAERLTTAVDLPYQVDKFTYAIIETVTDDEGKEIDVPLTIQITAKAIEGEKKEPYDVVFEDSEYAREAAEEAEKAAAKAAEKAAAKAAEKAAKEAEKAAKKKEE